MQSERQRIAQELHDSVKQQLFTLRMNLATAQTVNQKDSQTYDKAMQNAVSIAEAAQAELASLIDIFHQPHSSDLSVAEWLRLHVDEWSQQTGISAEQSIDVDLNLRLVLEHIVRRLLQESLANIFKDSGATMAAISVIHEEIFNGEFS